MMFTTTTKLLALALLVAAAAGQDSVNGSNEPPAYIKKQTRQGGSLAILAACGYGAGSSGTPASDGVANECCVDPAEWETIPDNCVGGSTDCTSNGGTACRTGTFSTCKGELCTAYCSATCAVGNPDSPTVGSENTSASPEAPLRAFMTKIGGLLLAASVALAF